MIRLALHDDNDAREHLPLDPTGPWRHVLRPDGPERGGSGANTIYQAPASRPPGTPRRHRFTAKDLAGADPATAQ